jgi:hypothetical protein
MQLLSDFARERPLGGRAVGDNSLWVSGYVSSKQTPMAGNDSILS